MHRERPKNGRRRCSARPWRYQSKDCSLSRQRLSSSLLPPFACPPFRPAALFSISSGGCGLGLAGGAASMSGEDGADGVSAFGAFQFAHPILNVNNPTRWVFKQYRLISPNLDFNAPVASRSEGQIGRSLWSNPGPKAACRVSGQPLRGFVVGLQILCVLFALLGYDFSLGLLLYGAL